MRKLLLSLTFLVVIVSCTTDSTEATTTVESPEWNYQMLDSTRTKWGDYEEPEWLRYFGLDIADMNGDTFADIVSGKYVYENPEGKQREAWKRHELGGNYDGMFAMDVDGDEFADVIAQSLPEVFWLEATDASLDSWTAMEIGTVPPTSHVNSQGFERGQIVPGGKEELLIAGDGNIYLFEIPEDPNTAWKRTLVAANTSDEGIGFGDIDGDGDIDIAAGRRPDGEYEPLILTWYQNPGDGSANWPSTEVGKSNHPIDRVEVADLDGDGKIDIIMTEERYPGLEPDGNLFWFSQPVDAAKEWNKNRIVTQYSMNNLAVRDLNGDGAMDVITAEHKGPVLETQLWTNDGKGNFTKSTIGTDRESHLGTKLADLDNDGDLDLVSSAWDFYKFLHVWYNPEK